ncbi:hypothetical protein TNCV_452131 [Trichonephila clavipes]|nr:hypothetical protein TNCV_452131 [Trichonephila clavipes]
MFLATYNFLEFIHSQFSPKYLKKGQKRDFWRFPSVTEIRDKNKVPTMPESGSYGEPETMRKALKNLAGCVPDWVNRNPRQALTLTSWN